MTGHGLKERRTKLGLSQEYLARSLDVALSTVARWEQLKDEEIPQSGLLELALNALEAKQAQEAKSKAKPAKRGRKAA